MARLLRTLGFFLVLVAVLTSPQSGFLFLLAVFAVYAVLVVGVAFGGQLLMTRHPLWAVRLTRLLGWLTGSQDHRITLLAIHKDNPAEADRIWREVEPKLATMNVNQAMAMAGNYAAALSFRGEYRRGRDLMIRYKPGPRSRQYEAFHALYWLNLGWFHYQLEDFQALEDCLKQAEKESATHPLVAQRLAELQALLAYERDDRTEVLRLLDQPEPKSAFASWLLSELGENERAAERLPDPVGLNDPCYLTYYHLAQATLTGDPIHLNRAAATTYAPGHIAYHALQHFQDPTYLPAAQERDPESLFTKRAAIAAVQNGDIGNQGDVETADPRRLL